MTPYYEGCGPRQIALPDTHHSLWCTAQRRYCPATSFMIHLECACTKRKKPSLISRTVWTPWRRSVTWQKHDPHSINNRLDDIKAEKYGPKLIMLANSFYACQKRKRTNSSPSGKVPSS